MVDKRARRGGGGGNGLPRAADLENRLCINVEEAAIMLGISRNFAYDLVRRGIIPSIKFGPKRVLIPKVALIKLLEGGIPE